MSDWTDPLTPNQRAARTHSLVNGTIFPVGLNIWYCPVCQFPVGVAAIDPMYLVDPSQPCSIPKNRHRSLAIGRKYALVDADKCDADMMIDSMS